MSVSLLLAIQTVSNIDLCTNAKLAACNNYANNRKTNPLNYIILHVVVYEICGLELMKI